MRPISILVQSTWVERELRKLNSDRKRIFQDDNCFKCTHFLPSFRVRLKKVLCRILRAFFNRNFYDPYHRKGEFESNLPINQIKLLKNFPLSFQSLML